MGYAGFGRPDEVVFDRHLSARQKTETLKHWQVALTRLARFASAAEREAYEALTIELAAAIERIDNAALHPHMINSRPLRLNRA